jgi:hypothetical protein
MQGLVQQFQQFRWRAGISKTWAGSSFNCIGGIGLRPQRAANPNPSGPANLSRKRICRRIGCILRLPEELSSHSEEESLTRERNHSFEPGPR